MKKGILLCLFCLPLITKAQVSKNKTLFVIVDGISAEQLQKVETPNLKVIAGKNGYIPAYVGGTKGTYSQTPTISAVGYNSLLTGTWVNKHNVWDNSIKAPNYHYPTVFKLFKQAYPAKRTAIFSTWLDNRTKLLGTGKPETGYFQVDYSFDGFELDTLNFPHDANKEHFRKIDELVVENAARYLKEESPDLTWVYLQFTDDMGHKYGNEKPFFDAIRLMDAQMGKLWEAVKYRQTKFKENWQVYITTDHGRAEPAGKNHGGQSDAERSTWIVTNAQNLNITPGADTKPAIVDIMPSILRHMEVTVPNHIAFEIDGVSLTGPVSVRSPRVVKRDGLLEVSWSSPEINEVVNIWLSVTNNFETGGSDFYRLMKQVKSSDKKASLDISKLPGGFYKVVIEGRYNAVNCWLVE